jgi:hypothetical protein
MPVLRKIPFRKIPVWIVLASYLFANTVASSLHDHRGCSGHSEGAHHHTAECCASESHRSGSGESCPHGHQHGHQHGHEHHTCHNHIPCTDSPGKQSSSKPSSKPDGHQPVGHGQHDPQHCVVCDFLALAPLSAPLATLTSAGELIPEFVVLRVLPVSGTTVETHLARGPPAA